MASLPLLADDILTYGSLDSGASSYLSTSHHRRPQSTPRRPRTRKLSTSEVLDEAERFCRRTISVCSPPPELHDILPSLDETREEAGELSEPLLPDTSGHGEGEGRSHMRTKEHSISNTETIIHILKGNIGIGVLTLPMALRNSGLIAGSLGLVIIAAVCVYCMVMLVRAAHKALDRRTHVNFLDYADTAEAAFSDAGGRWGTWAPRIRKLINTFLCLSQVLSNAVYVLFMAQNIQPILVTNGGEFFQNLNYRFYILLLLGPIILICMIRNLRFLSPFSVLANIVQLIGIGIIFYYIFSTPLPPSSSVPWLASSDRLPLFFGTAIFAIEGISVVLPIENQMRHPKEILGWNGVLSTSMTLVTALYVGVGFFGYLKYGEDIKSSITLNLPQGDVSVQATLFLYSLAIFFSYALQFYVLMEIVSNNFIKNRVPERWTNVADYSVRILLNLVTVGLAAIVPWLDLVVSLLGALKMSTLSIMAPAIIDIASNWGNQGKFKWRLVKNILIFIFGFFGFVVGTYVSLYNIILNFTNDNDDPDFS